MFNKIRKHQEKVARKQESEDFKAEFSDMTEDEHAFLTRIKAFEMMRNKRQLTFAAATALLRDYRALKQQAFDEGVTVDMLAARHNQAMKPKGVPAPAV